MFPFEADLIRLRVGILDSLLDMNLRTLVA